MCDDLDVSRLNRRIDKWRVLWQYIDSQEDGGDAKGARSMEVTMSTIIINGLSVDASRGFDVFRGSKLLKHFDTYAEARAHADAAPGRYVRYWGVKEGK